MLKPEHLLLALAVITMTAAPAVQAQRVDVFDNAAVNAAGKNKDFEPDAKEVMHSQGGRFIYKRVTLPKRSRTTRATLTLTLASDGDRWDKSGSCFILPATDTTTLSDVMAGRSTTTPGELRINSINPVGNFAPAIELLRFMTPFGVGHFSDDKLGRKPVYIPHWEKQVQWNSDVSQLISMLQGDVWIGIWIDSWTPEGYIVSMDITFDESDLKCDKITSSRVIPLINTNSYAGNQGGSTRFAQDDFSVEFTIPKNARNPRLYYITTGHGGHSGGDEFTPQQNLVFVDGNVVLDFVPWRDDCASFRRFNPGSGVWLIKRSAPYIGDDDAYATKEIEESLASSDLSRSNWCPGSCIVPERIALPTLTAGKHTATFSIPNAQPAVGNAMNHWLVSAYIVYDL